MRESTETMKKLAGADPLRDGGRLTPEELDEAEALLARLLATPVAPEAARPRPSRRIAAAAGAAAAAAVAFVAVNLIDSDAPGPGVVERAVAAVASEDVVYHFVEHTRATMTPGMGEDMTAFAESWQTADGRFHYKRFESPEPGAKLLSDFAGRQMPGREGGRGLGWDAMRNRITEMGFNFGSGPVPNLGPFGDPGAQLRALEEEGRLRLAGTTEVDGRRAYRLESGLVTLPDEPVGEHRIVFLVDAETYLPLEKRHTVGAGDERATIVSRYVVYERLPLDEETSELLALDPHPGAKCSPRAGREDELGFANPCAAP